jgi:hypothetical protein
MIAVSISRPETPWMLMITLDSFRCVFEQLLAPGHLGGAGLDQVPAVAGMGAQPPDVLGGHEAARQAAALGDLRQPGRVQQVFSELRNPDLMVQMSPQLRGPNGTRKARLRLR